MPFLEYAGDRIELARGDTVVGSGAQATMRLQNADLGARHFTVTVEPDDSARVRPFNPTTIVAVDGTPLAREGAKLRTGSVILAGSARFIYLKKRNDPVPDAEPETIRSAFVVQEDMKRAWALSRRTINVGRDAGATILLRDPAVSRFHADIRAEAGHYVLYSTGATGTRINGEMVDGPVVLNEGDEMKMGDTTLRFTRDSLPDDVHVEYDGEAADEAMSRRSTATMESFGEEDEVRPRNWLALPVIVLILVALALVAWLARS